MTKMKYLFLMIIGVCVLLFGCLSSGAPKSYAPNEYHTVTVSKFSFECPNDWEYFDDAKLTPELANTGNFSGFCGKNKQNAFIDIFRGDLDYAVRAKRESTSLSLGRVGAKDIVFTPYELNAEEKMGRSARGLNYTYNLLGQVKISDIIIACGDEVLIASYTDSTDGSAASTEIRNHIYRSIRCN